MHATIDGYGGNPEKLSDVRLVRDLLDRIPDEIGMTKITQPHVFSYSGEKPEDWGVSGFVIIAESHIAIHTFVEHQQVWVDVFSCKGFDDAPAIRLVSEAFDLKTISVGNLERGLEYTHKIVDCIPVSVAERKKVSPVGVSS